jgi:peptidoglycan/LPS O-acetylase OafA/YrhL
MHVPVLTIVMLRHWVIDVPGGPVYDTVVTALILVLPGGLLLSAFGYSAVERPFLSLRKRYVSLAAVPAGPPVPSVPPVPSLAVRAADVADAMTAELPRMPAQRAGA